jgi:arsenate reductase
MFSNTFAGIAPASVPGYVGAQIVGGFAAIALLRALYPDVTPAEAAEVVLPHGEAAPDAASTVATTIDGHAQPSAR